MAGAAPTASACRRHLLPGFVFHRVVISGGVPILTLGIRKIRGRPVQATVAQERPPHPPSGP
jgi:hypothetical protein